MELNEIRIMLIEVVLLCLNTVDSSIWVTIGTSINILLWGIAYRRMWRDHVCGKYLLTCYRTCVLRTP